MVPCVNLCWELVNAKRDAGKPACCNDKYQTEFSASFYVPTFVREETETEFFYLPSEIIFFQHTSDDTILRLILEFFVGFQSCCLP